MLKRLLLYFLGFLLLVAGTYYGCNRWQQAREQVNLWTLVPDNAALVVETKDHSALKAHLQKTGLWESLTLLPAAQRFEENLAWLDSAANSSQRLSRFLDEKEILTSIHVENNADVQLVYYVPVVSVGEHRFLRTLTDNISKNKAFTQTTREYQDEILTEVTNTQLNTRFTYFSYHNNIILSASPKLIEEIVRRTKRTTLTSIAAGFEQTDYLSQPDVYANVFVNYRNLPDLLGLFLKKDLMPQVRYLASLCHSGMLELKLENDKLFLNGFSNPEKLKGTLHTAMQPQKPEALLLESYLPNRAAILLHFGLEQVTRLRTGAIATGLPAQNNILDSLAQSMQQEVALAYLETGNSTIKPEKVVYARVNNPAKVNDLLQTLLAQTDAAGKKTGTNLKYGSYTIRHIKAAEFPAYFFGGMFTGFSESYAVLLDNYLVMAADVATLRSLLDDIAGEKVWAKSVGQQEFLDQTLQEANFSLYLNSENAWYILNRYITDESQDDLLQHAALIRRFNQVSLQFAKAEGQYYTSFVIRRPNTAALASQETFVEELRVPFIHKLTSQPFPVLNAVDGTQEVVVQDSAGVLHNITNANKLGWTDSLNAMLQTGIESIEHPQDKKLRYIFATSGRIHAINNQSLSLENFPFNVSDSLRIQHLAVFDYEKNKDYRLLVDDEAGNLYMYDLRGAGVEGWQPRRLEHRLAATPQHVRVGNRDVILVLLENGYIYALNKQGVTYPGFPLSLKSPLTSGAFIKPAADLRRTEITAVTKYGNVITFNLQGRVLRRDQLPRPTKSAMFSLLPESSVGRSFIVVRQDQGRVAAFGQDLKLLFEKRYVTSAPKIVQYYHFGGTRKLYAITETGPQKTYLYNTQATLIGNQSLRATHAPAIFYNEDTNNYTIYKSYRRELKKLNFKVE